MESTARTLWHAQNFSKWHIFVKTTEKAISIGNLPGEPVVLFHECRHRKLTQFPVAELAIIWVILLFRFIVLLSQLKWQKNDLLLLIFTGLLFTRTWFILFWQVTKSYSSTICGYFTHLWLQRYAAMPHNTLGIDFFFSLFFRWGGGISNAISEATAISLLGPDVKISTRCVYASH